jgi:hypothetical protein
MNQPRSTRRSREAILLLTMMPLFRHSFLLQVFWLALLYWLATFRDGARQGWILLSLCAKNKTLRQRVLDGPDAFDQFFAPLCPSVRCKSSPFVSAPAMSWRR